MTVDPLANPEEHWEPPAAAQVVTAAEVEQRVGAFEGKFTLLEGGLSNLNVLVDGRVLRIYRRDAGVTRLEAALLRQPWSSFRVPKLLSVGEDFLWLEHVAHGPVLGSAEHGAAVGRALAEIHARPYAQAGFLGAELEVTSPFDDLVTALTDHMRTELERAPTGLEPSLAERMLTALTANGSALRDVVGAPVLLHADFKASNLHWTPERELLVLDWEFAYAGSHLSDIGQLLRWRPAPAFVTAFAHSYVAAGRSLPSDFEKWAALLDLVNLAGLLANLPWSESASRRLSDVQTRIEETLTLWA